VRDVARTRRRRFTPVRPIHIVGAPSSNAHAPPLQIARLARHGSTKHATPGPAHLGGGTEWGRAAQAQVVQVIETGVQSASEAQAPGVFVVAGAAEGAGALGDGAVAGEESAVGGAGEGIATGAVVPGSVRGVHAVAPIAPSTRNALSAENAAFPTSRRAPVPSIRITPRAYSNAPPVARARARRRGIPLARRAPPR
jgi:hypothetical protein